MHCQAALTDAEQVLHDLYDKVNLPPVRPVVTRVERYVGRCLCCGRVTLAPAPEGLEPGTPFSVNILALATICASSADVLNGHRPSIWVSDLHSAQQGHADPWQICLAHQLRDCQYAIEAGDTIFAPRMK